MIFPTNTMMPWVVIAIGWASPLPNPELSAYAYSHNQAYLTHSCAQNKATYASGSEHKTVVRVPTMHLTRGNQLQPCTLRKAQPGIHFLPASSTSYIPPQMCHACHASTLGQGTHPYPNLAAPIIISDTGIIHGPTSIVLCLS